MVNIETLENKVKKLNSELDHFRNIESNEKSIIEMKGCIEEMEEQIEICEELVDEFEPRLEILEKSEVVIKEDITNINKKIDKTNNKINTVDIEVKAVNEKVNNIKGYNDSEIKKDLGEQKMQLKQANLDIKKLDKQKADKEHKHGIDDIEGLPAFLKDIKTTGPVSVGGYTKGVRSIVAGSNITIDNTDPRHPIVNSTGGGGSSSLEITQNAHGFIDLDWLYYDSSDSTFKKAQSNSISTLGSWHVVEVVDANTFKVAKDGTHAITNALALGEYVLSDTAAGGYTQTVPGDLGEYVLYGMEVISGTEVSFYTSTAVEVGVEVEGNGTANQITYWTDSSTLGALDTATYPSLTELSYVKGVTSSIQTQLNAVVNAMIYKGNWDASAGTFPGAGVAQTGWFYTVSVGGTVDSVVFNVGDRLVATANNASTTIYAGNWTQLDATDAVTSVNGQTGNVTGLQEVATVISGNTTASNDGVYVVVASATFTDPSPVEGKGYKVIVRNGTATVGGTPYTVAGSEILRIFHSGAWANYLKTPSSGVNTGDQTSIVGITGTLAEFNTALTGADFATLAGSEALTNKSVNGVTLVSGGTATKYLSEDGTYTTPAGGSSGINIWYSLTGTYVSTSTFTFSGDAGDAEAIERSLFTCLSSADARKIGYVKSASHSAGTVTVTVVTDIDLASGDKTFKVAINRKIEDYERLITIPGEQVADASNPQGMYYRSLVDTYLLPVNSFVRTAAAGSGAACAWNVYKGTTNLFTSAQDMTTSATFDEKRPNTNTISAGDIITLRVTSSAGATNKASDLQVQAFIVPQTLFTTAD